MENSTIYHDVKGMIQFCQWIRILPVTAEHITNTRKIIPKDNQMNNDFQHKSDPIFNVESYCYFKYSKLQFIFNLGIQIIGVALSCVSQALLYNLSNNATQKIGFVSFVFTLTVFPQLIVYFCNHNVSKVIFKIFQTRY